MTNSDWADEEDDDFTKITDLAGVREELARELVRNRAYLILLTGADTGKIHRLEEGECTLGRSPNADIRVYDTSVSRLHAKITLNDMNVEVHDLGSSNGTYINNEPVTRRVLSDGDKIRLGDTTILKFSFQDHLDEEFQSRLYEAALHDALTGAFNKHYLLEQIAKELLFAKRSRSPLSLLMIDIDHFKRVNDTHGHLAGDEVLKELAVRVQQALRTEDVFARYGGEEFSVLARGITLEQGGLLGERLRHLIDARSFDARGKQLDITISVGVATFYKDGIASPNALIEAADGALYEAKRGGRNRVVLQR